MRNDDLISRDALIMAIRDAHIISGTSKAMMLDIVMKAPTVGGWISVEDEMPKQHKSIFAPWYGTKTWSAAMWKEESETDFQMAQKLQQRGVFVTASGKPESAKR